MLISTAYCCCHLQQPIANIVESTLAYLAFHHLLWSVCSEYASPKSDGHQTAGAGRQRHHHSRHGGGQQVTASAGRGRGGDDGSVPAKSSGGGGAASGKVGAAGKRSSVPLTC